MKKFLPKFNFLMCRQTVSTKDSPSGKNLKFKCVISRNYNNFKIKLEAEI